MAWNGEGEPAVGQGEVEVLAGLKAGDRILFVRRFLEALVEAPRELWHPAIIVVDAISVVLAKGHVSDEEAQQIFRFATALGCTADEVRKMSAHLSPWFAANPR